MKFLTTFLALTLLAVPASGSPASAAYEAALARHVKADGVDYAAWKSSPADLAALDAFTGEIAAADPAGMTRDGKIAFLINAYNAWMLQLVLAKYPVSSVKDIAPGFGVFSRPLITVAGRRMSLNDLEKKWLLGEFGEPRVHFAVNCASRSCPPLKPTLWRAESLEKDLEAAARAYLTSNPHGFDETSGRISKIFDWYSSDFGGPDGVRAFIAKYRKPPADLVFLEYNWNLNTPL